MVRVIDNFFPESILGQLDLYLLQMPMRYGWKANNTSDFHGHWNVDFTGHGHNNLADVSSMLTGPLRSAWYWINDEYLPLNRLIRCYMNGHTYGVDGYYHVDSERYAEDTVVVYLNDNWNPDWGGETNILSMLEPEISRSILPKKNRAIIFPSNQKHCARSVSRLCPELRRTLMFKTRREQSDTYENLSAKLFKLGATKFSHKKGTLHDHLMRVYELLEIRKLPHEICVGGGIHSIFGTNAYKNCIIPISEAETLQDNVFTSRAIALAIMFSSIDRPSTLETPIQIDENKTILRTRSMELLEVPRDAFDALRYIEAANLYDQNYLNEYPNLQHFWEKSI